MLPNNSFEIPSPTTTVPDQGHSLCDTEWVYTLYVLHMCEIVKQRTRMLVYIQFCLMPGARILSMPK